MNDHREKIIIYKTLGKKVEEKTLLARNKKIDSARKMIDM